MARFVKIGNVVINAEQIRHIKFYEERDYLSDDTSATVGAVRISFGEEVSEEFGTVVCFQGYRAELFRYWLYDHTDLYDVGDIPDETPKVDEPLFEEDLHEPDDLPY